MSYKSALKAIAPTKKIFHHLEAHGFTRNMPKGVYVVQVNGGRVKIGKANDALCRWVGIVSMWPEFLPIRIIAIIPQAHDLEQALHAYFADLRVYSEWFDYDAKMEELAAIKSVDALMEWLRK